jgi:glycosyltransferase involved in cell wall biosynthesis
MTELVSIVIPVFNGARFVADAVHAAQAQEYQPVEVVVVDDGSTDATVDVATTIPGIRLLRQENAGPSAARNAGIAAATGDLLTFCDSDDRFLPTKVGAQVDYLRAHPDDGCVLVGHRTFCEPGVELPPWERDDRGMQPQSAMVRRSVVDQVGAFDPEFRFMEGMEWLGRLRAAGIGIGVLDEVHVERRIHGGNLSYDRDLMQHHLLRVMRNRASSTRAER